MKWHNGHNPDLVLVRFFKNDEILMKKHDLGTIVCILASKRLRNVCKNSDGWQRSREGEDRFVRLQLRRLTKRLKFQIYTRKIDGNRPKPSKFDTKSYIFNVFSLPNVFFYGNFHKWQKIEIRNFEFVRGIHELLTQKGFMRKWSPHSDHEIISFWKNKQITLKRLKIETISNLTKRKFSLSFRFWFI